MGDHLITTLGWQQVAAMTGVPMLAAATTAEPIAPLAASTAGKSLLAGAITGGRLGGIARVAASLLLQLGDTDGQRLQLCHELLVLLENFQEQAAHGIWRRVPVTVCDARGSVAHLKQSLPEIQPVNGDLSRPAAQIRIGSTPERIHSREAQSG